MQLLSCFVAGQQLRVFSALFARLWYEECTKNITLTTLWKWMAHNWHNTAIRIHIYQFNKSCKTKHVYRFQISPVSQFSKLALGRTSSKDQFLQEKGTVWVSQCGWNAKMFKRWIFKCIQISVDAFSIALCGFWHFDTFGAGEPRGCKFLNRSCQWTDVWSPSGGSECPPSHPPPIRTRICLTNWVAEGLLASGKSHLSLWANNCMLCHTSCTLGNRITDSEAKCGNEIIQLDIMSMVSIIVKDFGCPIAPLR